MTPEKTRRLKELTDLWNSGEYMSLDSGLEFSELVAEQAEENERKGTKVKKLERTKLEYGGEYLKDNK